jgi:hypothetical protein
MSRSYCLDRASARPEINMFWKRPGASRNSRAAKHAPVDVLASEGTSLAQSRHAGLSGLRCPESIGIGSKLLSSDARFGIHPTLKGGASVQVLATTSVFTLTSVFLDDKAVPAIYKSGPKFHNPLDLQVMGCRSFRHLPLPLITPEWGWIV